MTKIEIGNLIWNESNLEHLKKHSLTKIDVEKSILNVKAHKQGYKGRIILICEYKNKYISVVIQKKFLGKYYVVTARYSDRKERKLPNEKNK